MKAEIEEWKLNHWERVTMSLLGVKTRQVSDAA